MYSLMDAKLDASNEIKNLSSNFIYTINSNNPEILVSEDFIDIIRTSRLLQYAEAALKQKIRCFNEVTKPEEKYEVISNKI